MEANSSWNTDPGATGAVVVGTGRVPSLSHT